MSGISIQGFLPGDKRPYTYGLFYPDGRAFYYGKGTGNRVYHHRSEARSEKLANSYKSRVIRKLWAGGQDYQVIILAYHATEKEAFMHEIALIMLSNAGGVLINLTKGGDGYSRKVFSEEEYHNSKAIKGRGRSKTVVWNGDTYVSSQAALRLLCIGRQALRELVSQDKLKQYVRDLDKEKFHKLSEVVNVCSVNPPVRRATQ